MTWKVLLFLPAAVLGAVLMACLRLGKTVDIRPAFLMPWKIVGRRDVPREYWSAIWLQVILFAALLWLAVGVNIQ